MKTTKVLVVEDNPIQMELTQEILNSMGFTVHGARNGWNRSYKKN